MRVIRKTREEIQKEYGEKRQGRKIEHLYSRGQTQPFDHSLEPHLLPLIESPICR